MEEHRRNSPDVWIFDSGTTARIFRDKAIRKVAKEVSDGVIVANNMKASVVAKSNVTIKADLGDATEVLCIPVLAMNLWSMHKVCVAIGWYSSRICFGSDYDIPRCTV